VSDTPSDDTPPTQPPGGGDAAGPLPGGSRRAKGKPAHGRTGPLPTRWRRFVDNRWAPVAVLVVIALIGGVTLVAARGGGEEAKRISDARPTTTTSTTTTTTTTAPPTTTTAPPTFQLTGRVARDPRALARPALVVKIDNADGAGSNNARPQTGLNQADVVYEELVEGSVTRLAAVFHSSDSNPVGPIRSARTTDISLFTPLNRPLFAWSGANALFARAIRNSAVSDVGYDVASGVYYRNERAAPHDLFSSTPALRSVAPAGAGTPPPLFTYRGANAPLGAGARPVRSIHIVYGGGPGSAPVDYVWDAPHGGYARSQKGSPHIDTAGTRVTPENVIVQFVDYVDTGVRDVVGTPVPEARLVGQGGCWVLTAGHLIECRWSKASVEAVTQYVDSAGAPIGLTPGRTWVALVPPGGATITG
jgi:Protein of unknown function (DUF3048) N-terminal domain/Protein of unknown function (DUF3048) C-terminal domain